MAAKDPPDLNSLVQNWRQRMIQRGVTDEATLDELESHLLDEVDNLLERGLTERQAFLEAVARLGHENALAHEYRTARLLPSSRPEAHNSVVWTSALAWSYVRVAWRQLRRHPGYTLINLGGMTLSLTCALLIFAHVVDEYSYDRFLPESDRIYRVQWEEEADGNQASAAIAPAATAETFLAEIPEVEAATRLMDGTKASAIVNENVVPIANAPLVDPNFLEFFGYPLIEGDARTALVNPFSVVLTRKQAQKYFGDGTAVGEEITITISWLAQSTYRVTAVLEDLPLQTSYPFDILISYNSVPEDERDQWVHTFVRLREGTDATVAGHKADALSFTLFPEAAGRTKPGIHVGFALLPLTDIHFSPALTREFFPEGAGSLRQLLTMLFIGLFVVLIACVNYVNIATARAATRAKEVGVRKVLGSTRSQLVRQHMAESALMTGSSFVISLMLAQLLLPLTAELFGKPVSSVLAGARWEVAAGVLGFSLLVALLSGVYPALFISRWKPVEVLKGRVDSGRRRFGIRNVLVVSQFTASTILIVGSLLVNQQVRYMQTKDVGFERENVFIVGLSYRLHGEKRPVLREEVLRLPSVVEAGYGVPFPPFRNIINNRLFKWFYTDSSRVSLDDERGTGGVFVYTMYGDEHLIPTLGLRLV